MAAMLTCCFKEQLTGFLARIPAQFTDVNALSVEKTDHFGSKSETQDRNALAP